DLLTRDRLQEREADSLRLLLVATVGGRVERAAVVEREVDVLVRSLITGRELGVAEALRDGERVGGRLAGRDLDVTVLDALELCARVFDLTDGDALVERRGSPAVVGVRDEGHVLV